MEFGRMSPEARLVMRTIHKHTGGAIAAVDQLLTEP